MNPQVIMTPQPSAGEGPSLTQQPLQPGNRSLDTAELEGDPDPVWLMGTQLWFLN